MPKFLILISLSFGISLSGCGGGGGSGSGPTVPPPPPPPPSNQAPTANAGADQSVDEGTTVNLSATGTDSDGTIASYIWQHWDGPDVTMTNANAANMSFVAPMVTVPEGCTSVVVFRVTVTDDDGATGSDTVSVSLNDTNPPVPTPASAGFMPLGIANSAVEVSADGSVVVGSGCGTWGVGAFRWTAATGMVALNLNPSGEFDVAVDGVSADGAVVVGWHRKANTSDLIKAFRWTSATGIVELGDLPGGGTESYASAASADGSVVVGRGSGASGKEAFHWTSGGGTVGLGDLPGGSFWSTAYAVSADGSVVVGLANANNSAAEAFRWTSASGMVGLGVLPGGLFGSRAQGVSTDGSVIVGSSSTALGGEAMLWTSAGGMMGLGYLPGHLAPDAGSGASGVSADGGVVVGQSQPDNNSATSEAFVWTQASGMQRLRDVLIANGVTGLDNWVLSEASRISDDGQWVLGYGTNPSGFSESFLANISAP